MTMINCPKTKRRICFSKIPSTTSSSTARACFFPGERETIAASGIRFKNGKWPSDQAYVPGYYPRKAGTKGMASLCDAFRQLLAVLRDQTKIPFFHERRKVRDAFPRKRRMAHGHRKQPIKAKRYAIEIPQDWWYRRSLARARGCAWRPIVSRCKYNRQERLTRGLSAPTAAGGPASHFLFSPDILTPEKGKEWFFIRPIVECLANWSNSDSAPRPSPSPAKVRPAGSNRFANC
jgi:hypothetical protein